MVILFVCMGNVYRSRLAEAYLDSLQVPGITVRSAGVAAGERSTWPISPYAAEVLKRESLTKYASKTWHKLNQRMLNGADIVICVNKLVYSSAEERGLKFPLRTFIWDISDIYQLLPDWLDSQQPKIPHVAAITFNRIKERVNELLWLIRKPKSKEKLDVLAADGSPLGITADIDKVHQQGLWHRGAHAALYTPEGKLVMERRSEMIIGNAGRWDFTMGGIVGHAETPDETIRRELKEELGISVKPSQIEDIGLWRYNHYLPRYGLHSRALVSNYLIEVREPLKFKLQVKEVAEARLFSLAEATQLINHGHSKIGELARNHAYYRWLLHQVEQRLKVVA